MSELLEIYPGAQRALFRQYHIGGCSSCGFHQSETLQELCVRNENLPPAEVVAYLEQSQKDDERMMISARELEAARKAGKVNILDIRTREEYDAVHLPDTTHFTQELMQEVMGTWPKDELLVILDHEGKRSLDAAAYFAGHGFTAVKSLSGGIDAWSEEIDPGLPRYTLETTA